MVKDDPGFKAFCRRRSTQKLPSRAERWERARRARQSDIKKFMKPRGILSVLKSPYCVLDEKDEACWYMLVKQGDSFTSVKAYVDYKRNIIRASEKKEAA